MRKSILLSLLLVVAACSPKVPAEKQMVLIAPGHFHASLLQKNAIPGVSDTVLVFAPEGPELQNYLSIVEAFNNREENPTHWVTKTYTEPDWLEAVPQAKKGDFVVLSGNNRDKTEYILEAIEKGYNVLSDKPMAINSEDYPKLLDAYAKAHQKGLVLLDLLTERYDELSIVTKELVADKELVGEATEEPVEILDVHHFCKLVNGVPTTRPWWYYDVRQQGEGIADVSTHYIDLIWWQIFPGMEVTESDTKLDTAWHYPTIITPEQYKMSTGLDNFPEDLKCDLDADGNLNVFCNGVMQFTTFGRPVRFEVIWNFRAPEGAGDSYSCEIPFETANIFVCQNASTDWKREIFVETDSERAAAAEAKLKEKFDYISFEPAGENRYHVVIPMDKRPTHEEHFNMVGRTFISIIDGSENPSWEKVNTLTKYMLTTKAVELANKQ